ncbi:MAG: hypothetical protein EP343_14345 [Deltaproteobacteria bacterium]|nr:MAG: hypothetical protein EP343_14345 [Deltaproteobacteria bacterium]
MKIKGDAPQLPLTSTVQQQGPTQTAVVTTQQTVTTLNEAQANPAWQTLTQQPSLAPSTEAPTAGQSALRSQMQLAGGQALQSNLIAHDALAQRLGVDPSRLQATASAVALNQQLAIATGSNLQAAPLATKGNLGGSTTSAVRTEAKAAFEAVVEQSFMTFDTKSDNMARELSKNGAQLDALSVSEKARLIDIMGSGAVGNSDQDGILRVLSAADSPAEFNQLVQLAGGAEKLEGMMSGSNDNEFRFLVDKHATGTMTKDHPLRNEARSTFETILRKSHDSWDTQADNMVREFSRNPRMMEALTPLEKGKLIQILGSGVSGEGDEESIIRVLKSSDNAHDFWSTVQSAGGAEFINSHVDWKEQGQFDYLIDKFRRNPGTPNPATAARPTGVPATTAPAGGVMAPTTPMVPGMGMGSMMGAPGMYAPDLVNPWSVSPVINYDALYGNNTMPAYNTGMVTGMGQPHDLGIGRALKGIVGGLFRSIVNTVSSVVRMAVNVGINAGIGFLMGGPAGAAMGAARGLMGSMSGMLNNMGMYGAASMLPMLFSTMMGMSGPMMGMGGMGGMGMMMGMF